MAGDRLTERGMGVGAIHVNFSALQFSEPDLAQKVLDIIKRNPVLKDKD